MRKKLAADLKVIDKECEFKKSTLHKAERVKKELLDRQKSLNLANSRLPELEENIEKVLEQMNNLLEVKEQLSTLFTSFKQYEMEHELITKNVTSLSENLELYLESDEELQRLYDLHNTDVHRNDADENKWETEKLKFIKRITSIKEDLNIKYSLSGQYQAEHDQHIKQNLERKRIAQELIENLKFTGFSADLSDQDISQLIHRLENEKQTFEVAFNSQRSKMREIENELLGKQSKITSQLASMEESIKEISFLILDSRISNFQIASLDDKISEFKRRYSGLNQAQSDLDDVSSTLKNESSLLDSIFSSYSVNQTDEKIAALNMQIQEKEIISRRVMDELSTLAIQSDSRSRLEHKISEEARKKETVNRLKVIVEPSAISYCGSFRQESVERDISNILNEKISTFKMLQDSNWKKRSELSVIESNLVQTSQELQSKTKEIEIKSARIRDVCGSIEYDVALKDAEDQLQEAREQYLNMGNASKMYDNFKKKFEQDLNCPLCRRGFSQHSEQLFFRERLLKLISSIPDLERDRLFKVNELESKVNLLRGLSSDNYNCDKLQKELIPALRAKRNSLENEKTKCQKEYENSASELENLRIDLEALEQTKNKADEFARHSRELVQIQKDINQLQNDLSRSGTSKSISEVTQECEKLKDEINMMRREVERYTTENRAKQNDIMSRKTRINDLSLRQSQLQNEVKELSNLAQHIADLNNERTKLSKQMSATQNEIKTMTIELAQVNQEITSVQRENQRKEENLHKQLSDITSSLERIYNIDREISDYLKEGKDSRLSQNKFDVDRLQAEVSELEHDLENGF